MQELPERSEDCDCSKFDIDGLVEVALGFEYFSPSIEPTVSGYRIRECCSNDDKGVSSLAEVEEFMLSFADSFDDLFSARLAIQSTIKNESKSELCKAYRNALESELLNKAGKLWRERDG